MKRALFPTTDAERVALREACEADMKEIWTATDGGAAMVSRVPVFRNHGEEVAWWHRRYEEKRDA